MMKKSKVLALLLAVGMVISMAACADSQSSNTPPSAPPESTAPESSTPSTSDTFVLPAYLQLSGSGAPYGTQSLNAIKIAVDYVNDHGGFNGVPVTVEEYDTQCTTEEAVKVVQKIISDGKASAVIGSVNSSEVLASGGYLNDAGIVLLGLGTAATWMQQGWEYVWRPSCNVTLLAGAVAERAKSLDLTQVGVLYTPDDVGRATADNFINEAGQKGLTVVASEEVAADDTDFSAQINNILSKNPNVIYLSLAGDSFGVCIK